MKSTLRLSVAMLCLFLALAARAQEEEESAQESQESVESAESAESEESEESQSSDSMDDEAFQTLITLKVGAWMSDVDLSEDDFKSKVTEALMNTLNGSEVELQSVMDFVKEAGDNGKFSYSVGEVVGLVYCRTEEYCDDLGMSMMLNGTDIITESSDSDSESGDSVSESGESEESEDEDSEEQSSEEESGARRRLADTSTGECCSNEFDEFFAQSLSADEQDDPYFQTVSFSTDENQAAEEDAAGRALFGPVLAGLFATLATVLSF